jgi:response regulator RpfG family c-di-GMP phosphodiesterase
VEVGTEKWGGGGGKKGLRGANIHIEGRMKRKVCKKREMGFRSEVNHQLFSPTDPTSFPKTRRSKSAGAR